jgi:hypothetical protein
MRPESGSDGLLVAEIEFFDRTSPILKMENSIAGLARVGLQNNVARPARIAGRGCELE